MYLDPPYLMKREHRYAIDANEEAFHDELLQACVDSKAMLIISGYKNPLYSKYLTAANGWSASAIDVKTRGTNGADGTRTEILWTNAAFKKARDSGRVPIRLSKVEATQKKVNPARTTSLRKS
jgi:site-specific DNA-adenine methylase